MTVSEGDTIASGTALTAYCGNRNKVKSDLGSTAKQDATVSAAGTTILTMEAGAGAPAIFTMVLKNSTTYTITFTADTTTTIATITAIIDEE